MLLVEGENVFLKRGGGSQEEMKENVYRDRS